MATPANNSRARYWVPRIATAIIVPVLFLVLLEALLGLVGVGTPTGTTRPCVVNGRAYACDNYFFTRAFFPPGMLRTPRPYAVPRLKPAGTYRIFVLGESAAYGDPDPAYAFSRYLETMLRERFPGRRFEVFNAGITAINSHVLVPMAKDLAQYEPDLFVVYAGNNEVVGPYGPGTVFASSQLNRRAVRASIFVRSTRLGQLIDSAAQPKQKQSREWRGMEMFLSRQVRADAPEMEQVYSNFRDNLLDIISTGRDARAQVLVSSVPTNLKDCGPFASVHGPLTSEQLQAWSALIAEGTRAEASGDFAHAAQLYASALALDPAYAETEFRLGRALWSAGDRAHAREHFIKARDLDLLRFRADTRINAVIQDVATHAGPEVRFIDVAAVFSSQSDGGIPGSELFFEHVHMSPHGNYVTAAAMFADVLALLPADIQRTDRGGPVPSEELCNRLLALTPYDRSRLAADMAQRMRHAPFTNQVNHGEMLAAMTAAAGASNDGDEQTAAQYQWALRQNPEDLLLHLNYGMFLGHIDRSAALEELRRSRPYHDTPFVAPDGTIIR